MEQLELFETREQKPTPPRKSLFHPDLLNQPRFTYPREGIVIDSSNPNPPWED